MSYIGNLPTNVAFVTDTFTGNGSTTAFTMSVAPASTTSVLVAITGVLQDPSTYSVSGTTLTFSAAPPSGTGNISVRYLGIPASGVTTTAYRTVTEFTATAGQTSFSVPSYTVGYIDVYRNGSRLNSADYTASNGTTVVLAAGCNAGDSLTTESFYVSSVLNAIPATAGAVNSTYITDAAVTQAKLGTNVAGTGPTFRAAKSSGQTINSNTTTKVTFDTETFDTNNNFASSTFTPTVAGLYKFDVNIGVAATVNRQYATVVSIYKNGSSYSSLEFDTALGSSTDTFCTTISDLIAMNGTTDYIEVYFYQYDFTATSTVSIQNRSIFTGVLVRAS